MNTRQGNAHNLKQLKQRLPVAVAVAAVAAAILVPGGQAALTRERVSGDAFIPFVTDFPKRVVSEAKAEPFIPFVTDFPKPATAPVQAPTPTAAPATPSPPTDASASETDWSHVGIGSGVGAGLAVVLAGSWLVLVRRTRAARS